MLIVVFTLTLVGAVLIYAARRVAATTPIDGDDFTFMIPLGWGAGAILMAMALTLGWVVHSLIAHM